MDEFLKMVEPKSLDEVVFNGERLKFFNSQLKVWEYAKISAAGYQKLSFDDKSIIFKKHCVDVSAKYSVGACKI